MALLLKHIPTSVAARDRISLILDDDSPFLELMPLAGFNISHSSPCASVIVGIGLVQCVETSVSFTLIRY